MQETGTKRLPFAAHCGENNRLQLLLVLERGSQHSNSQGRVRLANAGQSPPPCLEKSRGSLTEGNTKTPHSGEGGKSEDMGVDAEWAKATGWLHL